MRRFSIATLILMAIVPAMCRMAAGKDFSDSDFSRRDMSNQDMEGNIYENCDFKGTNLTGVRAAKANFRAADFTEAKLIGADLSGADLRKAKLDWSRTSAETDMSGANFEATDLSHVVISHAKLRGANLRNLKGIGPCQGVDFRKADLRGANFTGFTDASAEKCKFAGAKYDKATRWPKGFDPEQADAVFRDGKSDSDKQETPRHVLSADKD